MEQKEQNGTVPEQGRNISNPLHCNGRTNGTTEQRTFAQHTHLMTRKDFTLSDLQHVLPAAQPAWIRVVNSWKTHLEPNPLDSRPGVITEWGDFVAPVLGYAVVRHGIGAYLLCTDSDGPCWGIHSGESSSTVELHVGEKPQRGIKPSTVDENAVYCPEEDAEWWSSFHWLIH